MRPDRSRRALLAALVAFALIQAGLAVRVLGDPLLLRDDLAQRKLRRYRQGTASAPEALVVAQVGSS
jgi:hypothetical protein